jgi:hypothetical protein
LVANRLNGATTRWRTRHRADERAGVKRCGRPRLVAACAVADAFDTAATVQSFARPPPRHRVLKLTVSALPAALGSWLAIKLIDPAPSVPEHG